MTKTKKGLLRRLGLILLSVAAVFVVGLVNVSAQTNDEDYQDSFDQLLEQLREELSAPQIRPFSGRPQIFFHDDVEHTSPIEEYDTGAVTRNNNISPQPLGGFLPGATRNFAAGNNLTGTEIATLTHQSSRVNVWTIDATTASRITPAMMTHFDQIINQMEQTFAPFGGVVVHSQHSQHPLGVGDIHGDGRVNVLIHNHTGGGFFRTLDYSNNQGSGSIPAFHVGSALLDFATLDSLYDTFAHEFQHLLFHMYFTVYLFSGAGTIDVTSQHFSWFNESLSEIAGFLYANPGSETISVTRIWRSAENSYANVSDSRVGDMINFNNSRKNYAMSRQFSLFMYRQNATYITDIYNFLRTTFPPATNATEFNANRAEINRLGMTNIVGNALAAAGMTGSTNAQGATAFNLLYFLFMESFAADGGTVNGLNTMPFINTQWSVHRLWGIRPTIGATSPLVFNATSQWNLTTNNITETVPTLSSNGIVILDGYNGTPPLGASHDRLYRLAGESTTNHVLTISVNDNNPMTQWYVVVPNDSIGAISSSANRTLGSQGATVHVLNRNNAVNMIDTGGQTAYLFVATLFRNVNATVTYSWGNELPPPPPPQRTITFSVAGGQGTLTAAVGSSTLTTGGTTAQGNTVTFTAAPAYGYRVASWTESGGSLSGNSTATERVITVGNDNITVSVTFEQIPANQRTITFSVAGGQGTLTAAVGADSITTGGTTAQGNTVTFTAAPAYGYRVASWTESGGSLSGNSTATERGITVGNDNITVSVTFEQIPANQRTITFSVAAGQGTLTAAVGADSITTGGTTAQGNTVTFTAAPAYGYRVASWTESGGTLSGNSTATERGITVGADNITVSVTFEQIPATQRTITFSVAGGQGTLTAAVGADSITSGGTTAQGSTVTFTAAPAYGYRVASWTESGGTLSGNSTATERGITVGNDNITVSVTFEQIPANQRTITFSVASGQGTLTAAVGSSALTTGGTTAQSNTVTFSAAPANGYTVASWSITGSTLSGGGTANTRSTLVGAENISVTVTFEPTSSGPPPQYTITFATTGNGTLTAIAGTTPVSSGTGVLEGVTINFTATPGLGYQIESWAIAGGTLTGNETDTTRSVTVGITNITINVTFALINIPPTPHNITVSTQGNGTASAIPTQATQGEIIELEAEPDLGNVFIGWSVVRGGVSLGSVTDCITTFTMPNTDVEVLAVFGDPSDDFGIIELNPAGTHVFSAMVLGYTTLPTQQIQVKNIGDAETGAISIVLSGTNADRFTVNNATLSNLLPGGTALFEVSPVSGLGVGTHTATITVEPTTASDVVAQSINVTFTVTQPGSPPPVLTPQPPTPPGSGAGASPQAGGGVTAPPPAPPISIPINDGDYSTIGRNQDGNVTVELPAHLVTELIEDDISTASFDLTRIRNIDMTDVTLPRNAVRRLSDEAIAIEILLPVGSINFDADAAVSLGEQAFGREITISFNTRTMLPNETMYRITASSGARDIAYIDGTMTITIPYQDETPQSVWMITEDGALIPLRFIVNEDSTITFTTSEFGTFIVSSEAGEDVEIPTITLVVGSSVININGAERINDVHPFVDTEYNRLMLPLRAIAEALGFEVEWNEKSRTATITREDIDTILLAADNLLPDGMGMPVIRNDRILLPLQFMAQLLDIEINWDYENITIYIS